MSSELFVAGRSDGLRLAKATLERESRVSEANFKTTTTVCSSSSLNYSTVFCTLLFWFFHQLDCFERINSILLNYFAFGFLVCLGCLGFFWGSLEFSWVFWIIPLPFASLKKFWLEKILNNHGVGLFFSFSSCDLFNETDDISASIICLIDASSRVATHHLDDLDLFTFLFSIRMLLDKWKLRDFE